MPEFEVFWNGTMGRTGRLLGGDWPPSRQVNPYAPLGDSDGNSPDLRVRLSPRRITLPMRPCACCQTLYRPASRTQRFCSRTCAQRAPKAAAFLANIKRRTG